MKTSIRRSPLSVPNAPSALSSAEARRPITRTNIILLGVLLAQIAIVAFVFWPRTSTPTGGGALLAGITADAVTAITITDESDRSVSFTQNADGWALANTDGYPANAEKISQTLTKLLNINTDRLVTRTSSSHSQRGANPLPGFICRGISRPCAFSRRRCHLFDQ
jgi:hypothetical protein